MLGAPLVALMMTLSLLRRGMSSCAPQYVQRYLVSSVSTWLTLRRRNRQTSVPNKVGLPLCISVRRVRVLRGTGRDDGCLRSCEVVGIPAARPSRTATERTKQTVDSQPELSARLFRGPHVIAYAIAEAVRVAVGCWRRFRG